MSPFWVAEVIVISGGFIHKALPARIKLLKPQMEKVMDVVIYHSAFDRQAAYLVKGSPKEHVPESKCVFNIIFFQTTAAHFFGKRENVIEIYLVHLEHL